MWDIALAVVFGAVQGITEFLPISSSGHLFLLHRITHFSVLDERTFDVALHIGTLLALVLFFWRDLVVYAKAGWSYLQRQPLTPTLDQKMVGWILVATIPGAGVGFWLDSVTETFGSATLIGWMLIIAGVALWAVDRYVKQEDGLERFSWGRALLVGCGQALALLPGVSRSGATMMVGRLTGLSRSAAARFSFLLAIPITAGAAAKKLIDLFQETLSSQTWIILSVGVVSSAIVGALVIRMLLQYIAKRSFAVFAIYRIVVGVAVLLFLS